MHSLEAKYVLPLQHAEQDFLELLVTRFTLTPRNDGVDLAVAFDGQTPAIWRKEAKTRLRDGIPEFRRKAAKYQERLDAMLLHGHRTPWEYDDPQFPFRYVSGGTLPIVRLGGREYYALLYREVFPIGWNIANGGSDTRSELLDPLETVEREFREELVIFDRDLRKLFVFDAGLAKPDARPEYRAARTLFEERRGSFGVLSIDELGEILLPVKWMDGPDRLCVTAAGHPPVLIGACFLNINAEDFGIEVDRIGKISPGEDAVLADGELFGTRPVGSVIGLFDVDRTDAALLDGAVELPPDGFYYDLRRFDSAERLESVVQEFVARMARVRGAEWDRREWDAFEPKYGLCPVTRRLLIRAARLRAHEAPPTQRGPYDVFVSYTSADAALAEAVTTHIRDSTGHAVFLSKRSTESRYGQEIDGALESSRALVAVASNPRYLARNWLQYEHRAFHMAMLSETKPGNAILVSYVAGFEPRELPLPLSYYQAIRHDPVEPRRSLDELVRLLV